MQLVALTPWSYIEDVAELKRLAAAAIYRPLKGAQLERLIETGEWPSAKAREWIEAKCANTLFCPMIESVTAIGNLDALCAVPGVDAVFVGPNDLTISMGIPEERDHPDFVDALQRIIDTAARHGIAAGAHFSNLAHATRAMRQGARFIPFSSDVRLIQTGVSAFLEVLRGDIRQSSEQII